MVEDLLSRWLTEERRSALASCPATIDDAQGQLVYISPDFEKLVGVTAADHLGKTPPRPWWPPEDFEMITGLCSFVSAGLAVQFGLHLFQGTLAHADGTRLQVTADYAHVVDECGTPVLHMIRYLPRATSHPDFERLSGRERDVARCLLAGRPTTGVAADLGISPHTVRNHVKSIFRKLDVHTRLELMRRYGPSS